MFDPLTLLLVGGGALAWKELSKKDFGILTPSRDERYRNAMEHCHQPELLLQEAKLFAEHGLKAQAAMLKRRAEWRARPQTVQEAHEAIFQKALASKNIPAILATAEGFEGWTATKKASALREHVEKLQEEAIQEAAAAAEEDQNPPNGASGNGASIPQNKVTDTRSDDT
jgi:DNA mismatch repair ATPase MutS